MKTTTALAVCLAACIFAAFAPSARAQNGECITGAACPASGRQYPTSDFSTSSSLFTTVATDIFAGDWARYQVVAGNTYEWTLCPGDGASAPYDAILGLRDDSPSGAGAAFCFSDNYCGTLPKIRWTATFTGPVRVIVTAYTATPFSACAVNQIPTTLRWRCASCPGQAFTEIASAFWTSPSDQDSDGCVRSSVLTWDPNVVGCAGPISVFERLYFRSGTGGAWTLLGSTASYSLSGCSTADLRGVTINFAGACSALDFRVEIYRVGQPSPDDASDPADDNDLNDYRGESAANDANTNLAPSISGLDQYRADTGQAIPVGGVIPFDVGVYFSGTASDPDPGDTVRLEVELRQLPGTFTGVANYTSPFVASGSVATTNVATGLSAGSYGWRVRGVDNRGGATPWFLEFNPDFIVAPPTPTIAVSPGSLALVCSGSAARSDQPTRLVHDPVTGLRKEDAAMSLDGVVTTALTIHLPEAGTEARVVDVQAPQQGVPPERIEAARGCTDCFVIQNTGSAVLNVSDVERPAWAVLTPAPPYSIAPSDSVVVTIDACGGCAGADLSGSFVINSDDPDSMSVSVQVTVDCPTAPPPCPGDVTGDATVTFLDITTVLANFGNDYTPHSGPGDADGSGLVAFLDITTVLANFGNTCP